METIHLPAEAREKIIKHLSQLASGEKYGLCESVSGHANGGVAIAAQPLDAVVDAGIWLLENSTTGFPEPYKSRVRELLSNLHAKCLNGDAVGAARMIADSKLFMEVAKDAKGKAS